MKQFGGPVLFLDRSDINTDEIIPAKYLNKNGALSKDERKILSLFKKIKNFNHFLLFGFFRK